MRYEGVVAPCKMVSVEHKTGTVVHIPCEFGVRVIAWVQPSRQITLPSFEIVLNVTNDRKRHSVGAVSVALHVLRPNRIHVSDNLDQEFH